DFFGVDNRGDELFPDRLLHSRKQRSMARAVGHCEVAQVVGVEKDDSAASCRVSSRIGRAASKISFITSYQAHITIVSRQSVARGFKEACRISEMIFSSAATRSDNDSRVTCDMMISVLVGVYFIAAARTRTSSVRTRRAISEETR